MTTAHPRAVDTLERAYDGAIPVDELARARAIDAAWEAADPKRAEIEHIEHCLAVQVELAANAKEKVLDSIVYRRQHRKGGAVAVWLKQWRQHRQNIRGWHERLVGAGGAA